MHNRNMKHMSFQLFRLYHIFSSTQMEGMWIYVDEYGMDAFSSDFCLSIFQQVNSSESCYIAFKSQASFDSLLGTYCGSYDNYP